MPTFTDVRSHQLDPDTTAWFTGVLEVIESLDADAYTALMTDDVELRLPDGTTLHGRKAVADSLRASWSGLASLEHQELNLYGSAAHFVHEARAVVTTTGGQVLSSATTSWIDRDDQGLIASARVYG